jgi:hypothetical protein
MSTFDDLYVSNIHLSIHYLHSRGKPPAYTLAKATKISRYKHDETIIAMIVVVAKNPTPQEIKRRKVVPLQEILNELPITLRGGIISWLIVEGEEESASLLIHTGLAQEGIIRFGRQMLMRKIYEKAYKNPFNFSYTRTVNDRLKEASERAARTRLANSEPVANYMR